MFTKWQALRVQVDFTQSIDHHSSAKVRRAMGLLKPDFTRFFAIGFAAGALIIVATMDIPVGEKIANGVIPVAEAQAAR